MTNEIQGFVIPIEARIDRLEKSLRRASQAQQRFASDVDRRSKRNADAMARHYAAAGQKISANFKSIAMPKLAGLAGPLMAVAGVAGVVELTRKLSQLSESYTKVSNTLRSIGQYSDEAAEKLAAAAMRSRAGIEEMAQSVARIQKASNGGYDETIRRVETINKMLTVGGATTAEVSSVVTQLGQALSSGTLAGDELKSLREAAPVEVLDAIAKAAGGTRDQLKDLGADGKLTTAVVLQALDDLALGADAAFGKTQITMSQASTNMGTAMTTFVGRLDEGMGASARLSTGLNDLAIWLNNNAGAAEEFGRSFMASLETAQSIADDAKTALSDLATMINDTLGGSVLDLGAIWADSGLTVGEVIDKIVTGIATMNGALSGAVEVVKEAFLKIPDAVTSAMEGAINAVITGVESMVNYVLDGVRAVAEAVDTVTASAAGLYGGEGTALAGRIKPVKIDRVEDLATGYSDRSISEAYSEGAASGEKAVHDSWAATTGYFEAIRDRYTANRQRLEEEARARSESTPSTTSETPPLGGAGGDSKGKGGSAKLDAFTREVQGIQERTRALAIEAQVLADVTNSTQNLGSASAFAEAKIKMLSAAQAEGRSLTPEQIAEIDRIAMAYANAGEAAKRAADDMQSLEDRGKKGAEALGDMFISVLNGSKSAEEAVADLLMQIAKIQFQRAFVGMFGGTGAADMLGGLLGFSSGGFTGHGGTFEPKGIVHGGEFVISKRATQRIGIGNLEALHRGALRGYSGGGLVGGIPKVAENLKGSREKPTAPSITISAPITVNGSAGTPEQNSDLAKQVARESEAMFRGLVRDEMTRQMRPGGMLR